MGLHSCTDRPFCTKSDYFFNFTDCNATSQKRQKEYHWHEPKICDSGRKRSVSLPKSEEVYCQGCGRGQFKNSTGECSFCDDGEYQDVNNRARKGGNRINKCKKCDAGFYAPRVKELGDLEEFPDFFTTSCEVATLDSNPYMCDHVRNWHLDSDQNIVSTSQYGGIPNGMKLSLKIFMDFHNPLGGHVEVTFKMIDF